MRRNRKIKMLEYTICFEGGETTEEEQKEVMLELLQLFTDGYMEILRNGKNLSNEEKELAQKLFSQKE